MRVLLYRSHSLALIVCPSVSSPNTQTTMNKTQFYLSQCAEAASKSHMCFTLGAVMVKGGKVISSGYNHHRPHYDGAEVRTHGHRKVKSRVFYFLRSYRRRLMFVRPLGRHAARVDARGDARDLQLDRHVPVVQDAGSRHGASGFTGCATRTTYNKRAERVCGPREHPLWAHPRRRRQLRVPVRV